MGESEARKRSRAIKAAAAEQSGAEQSVPPPKKREFQPIQVTVLGYDVVLDPFTFTIDEKPLWRRLLASLPDDADEVDYMTTLAAAVIMLRHDTSMTWEQAKRKLTWGVMLKAVKDGKPPETDHPQ